MGSILFKNFQLLDTPTGTLKPDCQVLVRDDRIAEVSDGPIEAGDAKVLDLGGRTLMPGLIDCHGHILMRARRKPMPGAYPQMLPSLAHANAFDLMYGVLMRGFTSFRDCAGADYGHKKAVELGLFPGPRLFVCGRSISQTGGHGDGRLPTDLVDPSPCPHLQIGMSRIADGVDAMRYAIRDEIRLGADFIKIMGGGEVASRSDPIDQIQFSREEIVAAVNEANRSHTYVAAHVYGDAAIRHCVEAGVHSIEHGNFLSAETAALMAKKGAYLVPTLVTYRALAERCEAMGLPEEEKEKIHYVLSVSTKSLEIAKAAGVKMAYGTDCFRSGEHYESQEFLVRGEVLSPAEIIQSATLVGAELLRMEGRLGVIAQGAYADLLVVDGNPLEDLGLFQDEGAHLAAIMKDGTFFKNTLVQ